MNVNVLNETIVELTVKIEVLENSLNTEFPDRELYKALFESGSIKTFTAPSGNYVLTSTSETCKGIYLVNGGSFEAFAGLQLDNGTIKDAIFKTSAMTFEVQGETTIINCTINTGSETVGSAPAAAVAVSSNGKAIVTGGTITAALTVYHVYSTGGSIIAKGVTVSEGYAKLKEGLESVTITIE